MYARRTSNQRMKETENNSLRLHSSTRRASHASFFFTPGRPTGSNSAECWKASKNYVNSRDENRVNAIQGIGIKILTRTK